MSTTDEPPINTSGRSAAPGQRGIKGQGHASPPPTSNEPPIDLCERHPECLFQGGCECKRQAMRNRATIKEASRDRKAGATGRTEPDRATPPAAEPLFISDDDRWHLYGVPGCIHEHDDPDQVRWNQEDGAGCDCN